MPPNKSKKKYWAFISYSSKDRKIAEWLHKHLENYQIPKELRGIEIFKGAVIGKYLRPVFRDRDELSGSAELGPAIQAALSKSHYLIVLCSRNSAQSKWVNQEIEDFIKMGGENRILALIIDGEPNATSSRSISDSYECFPPALRYPVEPLAGDIRKEGDGKQRGFLKILAGIVQLNFDSLYKRHKRSRRKRLISLGLLVSTTILVIGGLSIYGVRQRNESNLQKARAEKEKSKAQEERQHTQNILSESSISDHRAALAELRKENEQLSLAYFERGIRQDKSNDVIAKAAIHNTLFSSSALTRHRHTWRMKFSISQCAISPDGSLMLIASSGQIESGGELGKASLVCVDTYTGELLWDFTIKGNNWSREKPKIASIVFGDNGKSVYAGCSGGVYCFESKSGNLVSNHKIDGTIYDISEKEQLCLSVEFPNVADALSGKLMNLKYTIYDLAAKRSLWKKTYQCIPTSGKYFSSDGNTIITRTLNSRVNIISARTGEIKWTNDKASPRTFWSNTSIISPDSKSLATANRNQLRIHTLGTGINKKTFTLDDAISDITYSPAGNQLTAVMSSHNQDETTGILTSLYTQASGDTKPIWNVNFPSAVSSIRYSPDGINLVVTTKDQTLFFLDAWSGKTHWKTKITGHSKRIVFAPNNSSFAVISSTNEHVKASGFGNTVKLFETHQNTSLWTTKINKVSSKPLFSRDSTKFYFRSAPQSLHTFTPDTGASSAPSIASNNLRELLHVDKSSQKLIMQNVGRDIRQIDLKTGKTIWLFKGRIARAKLYPRLGKVCIIDRDKKVHILNSSNGKVLASRNFRTTLKDLSFSPDGNNVAIIERKSMKVFDSNLKNIIWQVEHYSLDAVTYSHDGRMLTAAAEQYNHSVKFTVPILIAHDATNGRELWRTRLNSSPEYIIFSPNDKLIMGSPSAFVGSKGLNTLDRLTGKSIVNIPVSGYKPQLKFSKDGAIIFTRHKRKKILLFSSKTGNLLCEYPINSINGSCAISPNGSFLATSGEYLKMFDISHLALDFGSDLSLLSDLLCYNTGIKLTDEGHSRDLTNKELKSANSAISKAIKSAKTTPLCKILAWRYSPLERKTTTPHSETYVRDIASKQFKTHIGMNDRELFGKYPNSSYSDVSGARHLLSLHRRYPWHPLAPIAIARLLDKKDTDLRLFLCGHAFDKLKHSNSKLWGKEHLAEDSAYAAEWMKDLGFHELAKETANYAIELQPGHKKATKLLNSL